MVKQIAAVSYKDILLSRLSYNILVIPAPSWPLANERFLPNFVET